MKPKPYSLRQVTVLPARSAHFWMLLVAFILPVLSYGQAKEGAAGNKAFSLKQALAYALENNASTKNAALDVESARAKVNETVALGLPQINGAMNYANTYHVQKFILENEPGPFFNPSAPSGSVVAFGLQLPHSAFGTLTWNQLIFNGSYIVGIQASKTFIQLAQKQQQASKIQVSENVHKAYYGALVNRERAKLLGVNIARIDSSLAELRALNKSGFVEKLDVDRLEVSRNNLLTERDKTNRLVELSEQLLKFQMGYPQTEPITLTDKLSENGLTFEALNPKGLDYSKRIEYSTLETQKALAQLELKNVYAGYLPALNGQFTLGSNTAASQFGKLTETGRWYYYDQLGFNLSVPIFDGFGRHHKAQQAKINIKKVENGFEQLRQSIDLQVVSANTNLTNAQETMRVQKRNMDLAAEVLRVARIKFCQGVGTGLEVTNAESELKAAQLNYYNAVYDALIAKIDQQVASGTLAVE